MAKGERDKGARIAAVFAVILAIPIWSCTTTKLSDRITSLGDRLEAELQKPNPDPVVVAAIEKEISDLKAYVAVNGDRTIYQPNGPLAWLAAEALQTVGTLVLGYFGIRRWRGSPLQRKGNFSPSSAVG